MKDMVWKPDKERDQKVNAYLDRINHAPYEIIFLLLLGLISAFTLVVLVGVF